jgi:DNA processing protein
MNKIRIIHLRDEKYPEALKNIYSPPRELFYKGDLLKEDSNCVAIVGSRKCSLYGLQMAEKIAFELASRGITVVSGMAKGVDQAAHRGALKAKGRTIAVMGSGFNHIYPSGSEALAQEILESGAVITEYTADTRPLRMNFPKRNRIISGLSKGVVVVEAAEKSGSLITVDFALNQGRDVFAVPGRVDSPVSRGTNLLIQNGAKAVMNVDDILNELDLLVYESNKG